MVLCGWVVDEWVMCVVGVGGFVVGGVEYVVYVEFGGCGCFG